MRVLLIILAALIPLTAPAGETTTRHWNRARGYAPFTHATPEGIIIGNTSAGIIADSYRLPSPSSDFTLTFRAGNLHAHPGKRYHYVGADSLSHMVRNPQWGMSLLFSPSDTLRITVRATTANRIDGEVQALEVRAAYGDGIKKTTQLTENADLTTGPNQWIIKARDGLLQILAGNNGVSEIFDLEIEKKQLKAVTFEAYPAAKLKITDISLTLPSPNFPSRLTAWADRERLDSYIKHSKDPLEGYWMVFDRSLEESKLRMGGEYTVAIVRGDSGYQLIYLRGAKTNGPSWKPGMVKAELTEGPFKGVFDVVWIDAEGKPLRNSAKAQLEDDDILTLQFPYHSSSLRLRKIP